ncbi:hypothetical protein HYU95_02325 [Candidatus Daviesbacteria bacterium]|nr:hypothetical protein [Candidatus Daviesbacteria bacterium]
MIETKERIAKQKVLTGELAESYVSTALFTLSRIQTDSRIRRGIGFDSGKEVEIARQREDGAVDVFLFNSNRELREQFHTVSEESFLKILLQYFGSLGGTAEGDNFRYSTTVADFVRSGRERWRGRLPSGFKFEAINGRENGPKVPYIVGYAEEASGRRFYVRKYTPGGVNKP